jgi:SAM-dependent methyltransferase
MELIEKYKYRIIEHKNSTNPFFQLFYWISKLGYTILGFCFSSQYRQMFLTRLLYGKYMHQKSVYTEINRYPDLFEICRDYLKENSSPKILSFGCSTGEEVFSIGKIIPNAEIVGTDINLWCIGKCRVKPFNRKHTFTHSHSELFEQMNDFDAILCLAIFQHPANRQHAEAVLSSEYHFIKFDEEIKRLDKKLKVGGIIVIDHSDFDFLDTSVAGNYFPLDVSNNKIHRERPSFNKENIKLSNSSHLYRIFVKT